ncbi:snf-5 [Pristionchus pacificus]|nr:snf-5 [Pristionchus pacificus]
MHSSLIHRSSRDTAGNDESEHTALDSSLTERTARSSSSRVDPMSKVFTPGGLPERDPERENRGEFQSTIQYILTCVGYAVGLGNIWRFPSLAYENGGGAFLITYICCAAMFGLPILFMELVIGQFTQSGSSIAFRHYFPLLQGLGWASGVMSISIAFFYNVIVAWTMLYMFHTVFGGVDKWSSCRNEWNTEYCESTKEDKLCRESGQGDKFFNKTCWNTTLHGTDFSYANNFTAMGPAEEFFVNNVLKAKMEFGDWGDFNWQIFVCILIAWILATLGLWKGVKVLGRLSLVTATTPYIIIGILFVRAVTLDGADLGIKYYLLEPDFSRILKIETWRAALTQACFSLSIGIGGMLSLASYNKRSHPCYRDALIICGADSFMSVFGGIAVFSTLGYLSKQLNVPIDQVVQSGVNLAFVAYPEAISRMWAASVWSMLFFVMLFFLGLSTMFGYLEGFLCCILDQWPALRPKRTIVMMCISCVGCIISLIFCFSAGIHWFQVLNDFIGAFALCVVIIGEIVLINFCYGPCHYFRDVYAMFGKPRNWFTKIFGPSGWYLRGAQFITAPILALVVLYASFDRKPLSFGKGAREFVYPPWVEAIGWAIGSFPVLFIPLFAVINIIQFKRNGQSLRELISLQPEHPAIRYELKDPKKKPPQIKSDESVKKSTRSQKSQRSD